MTALPSFGRFSQKTRAAGMVGLACLIAAAFWLITFYRHDPNRGLPCTASFPATLRRWKAYGGTWRIANGSIVNGSDERGAKLVTGSAYWENYSVEADLELLGINGNAGLMIRSTDAELGVDSYRGYYAGIGQHGLEMGRADHGWSPMVQRRLYGGVHPFVWYHLTLLAYGCEIVASVTPLAGTAPPASIAVNDPNCVPSGGIGLRSFSSGGIWRNVQVRPLTYRDLTVLLPRIAMNLEPEATTHGLPVLNVLPAQREVQAYSSNVAIQKINDLRLESPAHPGPVSVRGTVTLTTPKLFIQDSTGGISIPHPQGPPLKIGDEVEASGTPEPHAFSSVLKNATVRLLWEREPLLPLAVTGSQAATGAFDATFIQLDGYLESKEGRDTSILTLTDKDQSFRAVIMSPRSDPLIQKLTPGSLLRLRGISVVDPTYTHNLTPFVMLLPSAEDIRILAGPPWWSTRYLIATVAVLLLLLSIVYLLYNRIERWRLHAVLEERERMAHEMHDTLAQSFAGIGFQLQAMRHDVHDRSSAIYRKLDMACDLVRRSHQEARQNISMLRPRSLETADLLEALNRCAKRMVEGGSVEIGVSFIGESRTLPARISDTFFRIAQEAIANAVRHSGASSIGISLVQSKYLIELAVEDNGGGFRSEDNYGGFGLPGMRKRADTAAAVLEIVSRLGAGTTVRISASLPPALTLVTFPRYAWKFLGERRLHGKSDISENSRSYRG